nr:nuclear pore complex protein Nup107 isoform X2 [Parasteatoda tepidariorum]
MEESFVSLLAEKTPQRSAAKSSFVQKCITFGSSKKGLSFDETGLSGTLPSSREQSLSVFSQGNEYNMSGIFELDNNRESSSVFKDDFMTTKLEIDNTVLIDVDPGTYFTDSLGEEFLEFFLSYAGEHEIFSLLLNYENLCCKGIETLAKIYSKNAMTERLPNALRTLNVLQLERNTWRLMRILFQDRLEGETVDEGDSLLSTLGKVSDKQIVDNLYQRSAYIRQNQLIVDWLEKNADEDYQHNQFDKFEYFTDECFALEHTMNELITSSINTGKFSFEMDPDARYRHDHNILHETDKENEDRLFKFMFMCVRAGKLDAAQNLAEKFGQPWAAAVLEGWRLHHDPNFDTDVMDGQELLPVEGNKYRDLWKGACWVASEQPVVPMHEQALYGSLCGNLKAVLPVCKTWEDYLWAYTKTSLDKLIEQEIRNSYQSDRSLEDLPAEYWDNIYDTEYIFQELEASNLTKVKQDCKNPYHVIQKYIILYDLGGLIEEMYSWLNNRALDGHILRLMAHIILFLRVIGRSTKEELCIPILETYVQELIKSNKRALVAPYTSTLPKEQQIMWYAKFLEGVTDNSERQKCLQYAEDAGLDVSQITKTVVKNIREKEVIKKDNDSDLTAATTEEDFQKIHAIDWLIFNPNQRSEAVKQANALLRVFIAQRKLDAAKLLFSKIPEDSLALIMQLSKAKGYEELSADDDNTTREYLCFKAYLEAMDAFNAWFHHSLHAKPKEPQGPGDHVTFKEKVAHEHEMQQYEKDLKRWKDVVSMLGSTASECLYNVLLFVNGGWMVDQRTDGTIDEGRTLQLAHLRKQCIPHVSHLLQDLLTSEERYKEAIQLADILSSERYELYKEFSNEDIKHFLRITLNASFSLLDTNNDPLGYNS